jgi:hypothetical protein
MLSFQDKIKPVSTPTQKSGGLSFADKIKPKTQGDFRYDVPETSQERKNKLARYQQEAQVAQKESDTANSFLGKTGNFFKAAGGMIANSEVGLGQSIAKIIGAGDTALTDAQQSSGNTEVALLKRINENKAKGLDTTRLQQAYNQLKGGQGEVNNLVKEQFNLPSTSKVVGQIGGTALDLFTAGTYGKATQGMRSATLAPKVSPFIQKTAVATGLPELAPIARQQASGLLTKKGIGNILTGAGIGYASDVTQGLQGARGEDREGAGAFIPGLGTAIGGGLPALSETTQSFKNKFDPETKASILSQKRNEELSKLDSYQTLKKATEKGRQRGIDVKKVLSETDVLHGAVDNTGTITTKGEGGAVEQYTKQFIAGNEATVADALKKEGRSISLDVVRKKLRKNVLDAGIEGDALETALAKIDKEIAGYARRGGNSGTVPVATLHTAKVDKYNNINFFTEGNTKKYDKTVANALKELVEENTTSVKVAEINKELSKHFAVLDYLNKLDGKKVEGGKLGKYFAQTVGAIVGSHFGPLGAIAGAEAGGLFKGGLMSRVFNGKTGKVTPQAQSIIDAKKTIDAPALGLPAKGETTRIPSKPINLGARTQSTIDAQESMNPNIGTTAKGYLSTGKLNLTGDTGVKVLENPNKPLPVIPFGKTQSNKAGSLKSNQTTTIAPITNAIPETVLPKAKTSSKGLGTLTPKQVNDAKIKEQFGDLPKVKTQGKEVFAGGIAGIEKDEDGNWTLNKEKALAGMVGVAGLTRSQAINKLSKNLDDTIRNKFIAFIDAVRSGKVVTKGGMLTFKTPEAERAFNKGIDFINGTANKELDLNKIAEGTPAKIANFYEEILSRRK